MTITAGVKIRFPFFFELSKMIPILEKTEKADKNASESSQEKFFEKVKNISLQKQNKADSINQLLTKKGFSQIPPDILINIFDSIPEEELDQINHEILFNALKHDISYISILETYIDFLKLTEAQQDEILNDPKYNNCRIPKCYYQEQRKKFEKVIKNQKNEISRLNEIINEQKNEITKLNEEIQNLKK